MAFQIFVDEHGVPYSEYGIYNGMDIGRQRSILSVAERGLWYWNTFDLGNDYVILSYDWTRWPVNMNLNPTDADHGKSFMMNCADWLVDSIDIGNEFSVWKHPYPMSYHTKPGWRSAHSQAVGLQLLVRAAETSNDKSYVSLCDGLLKAYCVPVTKGGLLDTSIPGVNWYEKFADAKNDKPKVLNGMLFTIIGLIDIAGRTNNNLAAELADTGLAGVLKTMAKFDLGTWSAYDIHGKRASNHYHQIHIKLLDKLFKITGHEDLVLWRNRFLSYCQ